MIEAKNVGKEMDDADLIRCAVELLDAEKYRGLVYFLNKLADASVGEKKGRVYAK